MVLRARGSSASSTMRRCTGTGPVLGSVRSRRQAHHHRDEIGVVLCSDAVGRLHRVLEPHPGLEPARDGVSHRRPGTVALAMEEYGHCHAHLIQLREKEIRESAGDGLVPCRKFEQHAHALLPYAAPPPRADVLRTPQACLDGDAPREEGARDPLGTVLMPVHRGEVGKLPPGVDEGYPGVGEGLGPRAGRDADRQTWRGVTDRGEGGIKRTSGQGVPAPAVLDVDVDRGGSRGHDRDGVGREVRGRDGQAGVGARHTGTVQTGLHHPSTLPPLGPGFAPPR